MKAQRLVNGLPISMFCAGAVALASWWMSHPQGGVKMRLPGADQPPAGEANTVVKPASAGSVVQGNGKPGPDGAFWPQFRGPLRNGVSLDDTPLERAWDASGPRQLWAVDCGEGYAGAAVRNGCVYLMDYDAAKKENALRCLSLSDGRECWRYAYRLALKRNHGMTRSVPAVTDKMVVAMDPKCNVVCVDAGTGEFRWSLNLAREYGATVPPWYTGQCPLIDSNAVIVAPGGPNALLMALDLAGGAPLWRTPNPHGWKMTHSSVMPMAFEGRRFYIYCGSGGVTGVSAKDGSLLWETADWKISIANVPSPLVLDGGRIFLSGGYNAGSLMLQLQSVNGRLVPKVVFRLNAETFGATQHTPVFHDGYIYGVRPNGQFTCLDLTGKVRWTSPLADQFGLGSFLLADGLIFVMNDSGDLSMLQGSSETFQLLAKAKVLNGRESWGPMALVKGRLFVRDFTRLACLDVAAKLASASLPESDPISRNPSKN